ncbi:MAG TPA: DUF5700 domain-containing putative Zn-dependent protease [Thermoanaerobaculia bacterium]|nr:DUF5700 domain-containing putative Zn-dependent protease [Thermoanaerobaculia bacterium]
MRHALVALALFTVACTTTQPPSPTGEVRMVVDEANAVLAILDKRQRGDTITDADWQRVFASEGYVRLKAREHSMKRAFEDETFRQFVMSDELLARREELATTVKNWLTTDISNAAAKALAYLPKSTRLRAKVYPVIKPAKNSFVFDLSGDPAIFIYVEAQSREVFAMTIAHELHHVGYAAACPVPEGTSQWIGAFGEGLATLAAAGGPQGIPQQRPDVMAEWTKQMAQFDQNFREVEAFLSAVEKGELTGDAETKRGFELFGIVGPWYTVGWKMAVVIEKTLGRDALIAASCNGRELLRTYNRAVAMSGEPLPTWP